MTKKTVKALDSELSQVKNELKDLKVMFDTLADKYAVLEKKHDDCVVEKTNFECSECEKKFKSKIAFDKHKKSHNLGNRTFKCDGCERLFNEEWKLNAHKKTHRKHVCGECEETFKFEDILEKHKAIKHGNLRIFCSFFNNELECPHGEKCVFLHEHSDKCK